MTTQRFFTFSPAGPIKALLYGAYWLGFVLLLLGMVITFFPGAEVEWFATAGTLLLAGLLVPRWDYRVSAIFLVGVCITFAVAGYRQGVEYRHHLQERGRPAVGK
jgi:hypothetical protein